MMTPIHAGSEDYFKQLNGLKTLPSDPATLQYLTHLLNNPNSPFEKFLVGGKIQQIEKDLAAQKGMQAQGQVGGGLPTIKDKLEQSASLLAAQSAAQGRGQMPAPAMPTSAMPASSAAVSPEEEMQMSDEQPEETMGAAYGGIMNAPLHKDTFSFAPGGIVAFANPEKEKKQQVKDEDTTPQQETYAERDVRMHNQPALSSYDDPYSLANIMQGFSKGASNIYNALPEESGIKKIGNWISAGRPGPSASLYDTLTQPSSDQQANPQMQQLAANVSPANIAPSATSPNTPVPMKPETYAQGVAPMPGPNASVGNNNIIGSRRNMDQIMAEQAAMQQAARTKPSVTNIAPVKPNIAPITPAGDAESLKMIKDELSKKNTAIDNYVKEIPKDKSIEEIAKDIKDADLAFGVGSYEKWAKEKFKERQTRFDKQTEGRGRQDAMAQLAAYSRPGARWSDVLERDIQNKSKHLEEDRQFQTLQDNYEDSIYKMAEERSVGNAKDLRAAMKDQKTTKAAMLQHIMTAYDVPLQVAERIWSTQAQVAEQARGHTLQHEASMANAAANMKSADARKELAGAQLDFKRQQLANDTQRVEIQFQGVLNKNEEYRGAAKIKQRLESQLSATQDEAKQEEIKNKISDQNAKIIEISSRILGGGIKSQLPATGTPTTGSNIPPRPPNAVQLMPK